jgi:hypothetical protein
MKVTYVRHGDTKALLLILLAPCLRVSVARARDNVKGHV